MLLEERSINTDQTCAIPGSCWRQRAVICPRGWWWSPTGFHLTRARMLAERAGYDSVSTLAAPSSHLPSRLHMYVREPLALVKSFFLDR